MEKTGFEHSAFRLYVQRIRREIFCCRGEFNIKQFYLKRISYIYAPVWYYAATYEKNSIRNISIVRLYRSHNACPGPVSLLLLQTTRH